MSLGEKIVTLRKSRGMSQEQLAEKVGVSRQAVSKWELNESVPDINNVVALSRLFGVTTDYIINDEQKADNGTSVIIQSTPKSEFVKESKAKIVLAWILSTIGTLGILVLCVMSSLIESHVPTEIIDGEGTLWLTEKIVYSFWPFIEQNNFGVLLFLLVVLLAIGVSVLLYDRYKDKKRQGESEEGE